LTHLLLLLLWVVMHRAHKTCPTPQQPQLHHNQLLLLLLRNAW
jgi:hypothetical protein